MIVGLLALMLLGIHVANNHRKLNEIQRQINTLTIRLEMPNR